MKKKHILYTIQSIPLKLRLYRVLRVFVVWFLFAAIANLLLSYLFYTPKSYYLNQDNKELISEIEQLSDEINSLEQYTSALSFRYVNTYKSIFGMEQYIPYENKMVYSDKKYDEIHKDRYRDYLVKINRKADMLSQDMAALSYSLDSVSFLVKNKNKILKSIPTILPLNRKNIKYISDRFGWRYHPIRRRTIFHEGTDFACPRNTPIYSTADGVVVKARFEPGYGRVVDVDHGFGYKTRYAHLNSFAKGVGDKVLRGEVIAMSGNTGSSTGPHLHYEVIFNKTNMDPEHFFSQQITDKEFAKILESAKVGGDARN